MSCFENGARASPPPPPTPFLPPVPLSLAGDPGVGSGEEEEEKDLDRAAKWVGILDGPHPQLEAVWKLTQMHGTEKGKDRPPGDSSGERISGAAFGGVAEHPNVNVDMNPPPHPNVNALLEDEPTAATEKAAKTHQSMHARAAVENGTQGIIVYRSLWLAVSGFAAQRVLHKASSAPSRLVVLGLSLNIFPTHI
jgi:hypothetical protein